MSPTTMQSACTVTTTETLPECLVAIFSLRKHHPGLPIYVACQEAQAEAIRQAGAVPLVQDLGDLPSKVKLHNLYHRPDAIRLKMDAMEHAIEKHGDALFFDADIVFMQPIQLPPNVGEVMLSLNLSVTPNMQDNVAKFGLFNAGLIWSRSLEFVRWWRQEYLNPTMRDAFYEQGCLGMVPHKWQTDFFPLQHNWGFWRGKPARSVGSYHLHLSDNLFMTEYIREGTLSLRPEVWSHLPSDVAAYAHKQLGHADKIWFVHFGKAAGVYTAKAFKRILTGYTVKDSWQEPFKLGRDWTSDELTDHLANSDSQTFLHQHHGSITTDHLLLAKQHGWKTVMFYRDPRELICSLYHFARRRIEESGEVQVFEEPQTDMGTFDQFFTKVIKHPKLWAIPEWSAWIDHCLPFSIDNLDKVMVELTGSPHLVGPKLNTSANPGWKAQMTSEHLAVLDDIPAFRQSVDWLDRSA